MNPRLAKLHPYPFEKLSRLLAGVVPSPDHSAINLSIGEPKHPVPPFIRQAMADTLDGMGHYPVTRGNLSLRQAIADWLHNRFQLTPKTISAEHHVLPVNGTREALFSFAQAITDGGDKVLDNGTHQKPVILMPNPFYQIYEGAALMAGAEPVYVESTATNNYLPNYQNLPKEILTRTVLLYLCSPSNPTGAVFPLERLKKLVDLAHRYHFVIAADECYSEIWYDQPPPGLLTAAQQAGQADFNRCLVFHSLSKRSNMPGARSGFVAGNAQLLKTYFQLRTYTGCATPPFIQQAATVAWGDETHVEKNRALYHEKLETALAILKPVLPVTRPDAGFYLWLRVPGGGEAFARHLLAGYNVTVLPGAYLGRPTIISGKPSGQNPGADYVRVALVASRAENQQAMTRIAACAQSFM